MDGETVSVVYTPPTGPTAQPIRDAAGNAAAGFTGQVVAGAPPPHVNTAPVGSPWIDQSFIQVGVRYPRVGMSLSASTKHHISDADGLTGAVFAWQWISSDGTTDTDIAGATEKHYTPTVDQVGKFIKVRATYTDDAGTEESVTGELSPLSAVLAALPSQLIISASPSEIYEGQSTTITVAVADGASVAAEDRTIALTVFGKVAMGDRIAHITGDITVADDTGTVLDPPYTLTLPAGAAEVTATVTAVDDVVTENDETIKFSAWDGTELSGNNVHYNVDKIGFVYVTIAANEVPVADAGIDSSGVRAGTLVTLDGSGSRDPDAGDTLSYLWTQTDSSGHTVTLSDPAAPSPTFTAPANLDAEAALQFTLQVTDAAGARAEDSVVVAVAAAPLVSIRTATGFATEGEDAAFTLLRAGSVAGAFTVSVAVSESGAMLGGPVPTQVVFADGSSEAQLRVPTEADGADEADSVVMARIEPGYRVAGAGSASVTVLDDDAPAGTTVATTEVLWSADVTVTGFGGAFGAITSDSFSNVAGSGDLGVVQIWYSVGARRLDVGLSEAATDAGALTLHLDDVALAFPQGSSGKSSIRWRGTRLSWKNGQTVAVRLTRASRTHAATGMALRSLAVSDATLRPVFDPDVRLYTADVDSAVVTVSAAGEDNAATVAFEPSVDADAETPGHQVAVPFGETMIVVSVTGADGATRLEYRVVAARAPPPVDVSFAAVAYTATEGGTPAAVTVRLSADPERAITVPLTATPADGADGQDYSVPDSVSFASGGPLSQTITVAAADDEVEEDGESVVLGFGILPPGITASGTTTATVALADAERVNASPTGVPTISGTARVGETLTASVSGIADADGLSGETFGHQWLSNDGTADTDIAGATEATYTLAAADAGRTIKVRVTFTDDGGWEETLISEATAAVEATLPGAPREVAIAVPRGQERALEVYWAAPLGDGGSAVTGYTVQWKSGSEEYDGTASSTRQATVSDLANLSYRITGLTSDMAYTVRVIATNGVGDGAPSAEATRTPPTGLPTISGTVRVGETLTASVSGIADADGLSGETFGYQWLSNDGTADTDIAGATEATYTLAAADTGRTIKVRVTFTDDGGTEETLISEATAVVEATLPGAPREVAIAVPRGQERALEVYWAAPLGDGGSAVTGYTVQWKSGSGEYDGTASSTRQATVSDLANLSYPIAGLTNGVAYTVRMIATNGVGDGAPSAEATRTPRDRVRPELLAAAVNGKTLALTWNEALDESSVPAADAFAVSVAEVGRGVTNVAVAGSGVRLTLSSAVTADDVVTVGYTVPAALDAPRIQDAEGNAATAFSGEAATNNSSTVVNTPPTGLPTISGTARVGETLTASETGIADADGLSGATFDWQWISNDGTEDTDIGGATAASYDLVAADVGRTIKARVSFTDDGGTEETLVSTATAAVEATVPDAPRNLTVAAPDGKEGVLEVSWEAPGSDGGSALTGYKVQWKSGSEDYDGTASSTRQAVVTDLTGPTHTVTGLTNGVAYTVRVFATNGVGAGAATADAAGTPRDRIPPDLATAAVNGETLTLTWSEALDASSEPAADAFAVSVGGVARGVTEVAVAGSAVVLTLASPVATDDVVTVGYTVPTGASAKPVQDAAGNPAATFVDAPVTNATVALPVVSITASATPVTEGTAAAFALARTGSTDAELTVQVAVSESEAAVSGTPPMSVTFAAGSGSATLIVATEDDEVSEAASTVTATVSSGTGYTADGTSGSAEVVVEDDDAAPVVSTSSPIVVAENVTAVATLAATDEDTAAEDLSWSIPAGAAGGADGAKFALTAGGELTFGSTKDFEAPDDANTDGDYEVTVRVTDGSNPVDAALVVRLSDVDEVAPTLSSASVDGDELTLTFSEALDGNSVPPESSFAVTVAGSARTVDAVVVLGSAVTLTLSSAVASGETVTMGYTVPTGVDAKPVQDAAGNPAATFANAQVANETAALPVVSIAPSATPVTEGTAAAFTLARTGATDAALTAEVSVSETEAMVSGTPPTSVTFAAGSGSATLSVETEDDEVSEAASTVTATVSSGSGYTVDGTSGFAEVVVEDDDAAPVADAGADIAGVSRGATVTLDGSGSGDPDMDDTLTWLWTQTDASGYAVVLSDAAAKRPTFTMPSDIAADAVLVFTLRVTDAGGLFAEDSVRVSVAPPPAVSIRRAGSAYAREGEDAIFTLTRTGGIDDALTLAVTVTETGRMLGTTVPSEAAFEAGQREATLRVPSADDGAQEADSVVTARIGTGAGYRIAADAGVAAVTVLDDDAPAGTTVATTEVLWSADVTVTGFGGAFGAITSDSFSNVAGSGDLGVERIWYSVGARRLDLLLSEAATDAGELTLHLDDVALAFPQGSSGKSSIRWRRTHLSWKNGQTVAVRLTRASQTQAATSAELRSLTVSGATLSPAFDPAVLVYAAEVDPGGSSVTVSAAASDSAATVAIEPSEDADAESPDHQVAVPFGETLITVSVTAADEATRWEYRVVANRLPPPVNVSFGAAAYTATEGGTPAAVIVSLSADPEREVTVPLTATSAGGADAQDYAAPDSVTFASGGPLSQTITVAAADDEVEEDGESVVLGFGSLPRGITASGTTTATVALADAGAAPEPVNTPPTGLPTISGTARVGETLTASETGIADADGLSGATFDWQWISNDGTEDTDIGGATAASYELVAADVGRTIKARVSFTDDGGTEETLVSTATAAVEATVPDAPRNLSIAVPDGKEGVLEVSWEVPGSDGGSALTGYKVQWKSGSEDYDGTAASTRQAVVTNLTGPTHTITGLTNGVAYTVRVFATNGVGAGAATADAAGTPRDRVRPDLATAAVDGAALVLTWNEALDASSEPAADAFAVSVAGVARGVTEVAVAGSAVVLTLASPVATDDVVTVGYTAPATPNAPRIQDEAGNAAAAFSGEVLTNSTAAPVNTPPTGLPTISGAAHVGETLTASESGIADEDGLSGATFAWQWIANDGTGDTDISGATETSYALGGADAGKTVKVRVTFTDDGGTEETLTSAATEPVAIPLTAHFENVPENHDGAARFTFDLRFSEEIAISYRTLRDQSLELAGGTVRGARRLARPSNMRWRITVEPDVEGDLTITLPADRACNTAGAICTSGGKRLSSRLDATVAGPASPALPEVSIAAQTSPVTEGTAAVFSLTRSGSPAAALTVDVAVTESGAMLKGAPPASVTFAADAGTAALTVETDDDGVDEPASTITAAVSAGDGHTVDATAASAAVTVNDDDAAPVVATASPIAATENGTAVATLAATDEDTPASDLAWSIAGGADADQVHADGGGGAGLQGGSGFRGARRCRWGRQLRGHGAGDRRREPGRDGARGTAFRCRRDCADPLERNGQ